MIKIYLDDERQAPSGWIRVYTVEQTIEFLKTRQVGFLSLDNDLGEGLREGYLCLDFLEEQVYNDPTFPIPEITIHSANASRVQYMKQALNTIERIRQQQISGE